MWQARDDIRQLRDELYRARRTVLSLLPEGVEGLLQTYYDCRSLGDLSRWERDCADRIMELAQLRTAQEMGEYASFSDRALCPLVRTEQRQSFRCAGLCLSRRTPPTSLRLT